MDDRPIRRWVIHPGAPPSGFDFPAQMRVLCGEIVGRTAELAHVDLARVAIGTVQIKKPVRHGVQATLTPLRFIGGTTQTVRRGRKWAIDRLVDPEGREYLYLLRFYLPRFLEHALDEKLTTVFHELWHISPEFDGDIRRHAGRCHVHTHSQREYDEAMRALVVAWLRTDPPRESYAFLEHNFRGLERQFGAVYGRRIPSPRLRPIREGV